MTHAENYANRSAFYKSQRLVQTCIECGKQRLAQRAKANRRFCSLACGNPNTQKICSRCRAVKPIEEFHRRGNRGDGRAFYCKPCQAQRYQARRQQCQK